jgi:hypothetical protein
MVIDERHEPEPIGHGFQRGHITMLVGVECELGLGIGQEPVEELVRGAEMEQRDRPRFAIDAARLHDAVVSVSPSFDFLNACHRLYIHETNKGVKPWKIMEAPPLRLCIHLSKGEKRSKSNRVKGFATSSRCVGRLLPESRASLEFPRLKFAIRQGEVKDLPADPEAAAFILATAYIREVPEPQSETKRPAP